MKLKYEYSTKIVFSNEIGQHNFLLRCQAAKVPFMHNVKENIHIGKEFWHEESQDGFGNRIIYGGMQANHSTLYYSVSGTAEQDTYCIPEASPHPMFRFQSEITQSDIPVIKNHCIPFLDDCIQTMHYVHDYLSYCPGSTDTNTSVRDILKTKKGVCQDYAHLMISICRAGGYPARYVCGLMQGEGHTHAWVEVHDGQCWYAFDPTNDTAIANGYVKIAHGRDATDCPVCRGIFSGKAEQTTIVTAIVNEI